MPDARAASARVEAFHLSLRGGRRFCLLHSPCDGRPDGRTIVYVHPFGEEMNKARRMAALQARALARAGWTVLQIDLGSSGDSDGEFGDASWAGWIEDVTAATTWLRQRSGSSPWLWGLRAGCLVAADAARAMSSVPNLLFWQPVVSGRNFLQQLLRLRIAAQMMASTDPSRTGTRDLGALFAQGHAVEIAGYEVSPDLALGMEASELTPLPGQVRVVWIEVSAAEIPELSPAATKRIEAWRTAGHRVDAHTVTGPAFWQTQEIAESADLIQVTLAAMSASSS